MDNKNKITKYSQFRNGLVFENKKGETYIMVFNKRLLLGFNANNSFDLADCNVYDAFYKTFRINNSPVVRIYSDHTLNEIVYEHE